MKILFRCLLFLLLYINTNQNSHSQDTTSTKYFPLKVGNIWIYTWANGANKQKISITGTTNANGHLYYSFLISGANCTPCPTAPNAFLMSTDPIRVDSVTGNVMALGTGAYCPWYNGEYVIDSLKRKIDGGPVNQCGEYPCTDTSMQMIFGNNEKTKTIGLMIPDWSHVRRYAHDFGIIYTYQGCWIAGSCIFNLSGCVIDGIVYGDTSFLVGVTQISSEIPKTFSLYQNYPNPFNPVTKIKFSIPPLKGARGMTSLIVYDALGQVEVVLVNEQLNPGTYETEWDASTYPSGVYFYKLEAGSFSETKKMVLIK
jgi:hypothetical protein